MTTEMAENHDVASSRNDGERDLLYRFPDDWTIELVTGEDEIASEFADTPDAPRYLASQIASGSRVLWSLRQPDGQSIACVIASPEADGYRLSWDDFWYDNDADEPAMRQRLKEWLVHLRGTGERVSWQITFEPYLPDVRTPRELVFLMRSVTDRATFWRGSEDQIEVWEPPGVDWEELTRLCLTELRNPYWPADERPEELFGQAFFLAAVLSLNAGEQIASVAEELTRLLEDDRDGRGDLADAFLFAVVNRFEHLGLPPDPDTGEIGARHHPRWREITSWVDDVWRREGFYASPMRFVTYLSDLLELLGGSVDALRHELPTLAAARAQVAAIERAGSWRPEVGHRQRPSPLATTD